MSDTVRDAIWAAIEAALTGAADEIEIEPIGDPSSFDALHLFDSGHAPIEFEAGLTRYRMEIEICGYVEGEGGPAPTAARNALHARTMAALFLDETLGATVELIEDGPLRMFTAALSSSRRLGFSQDLFVQFTTSRGNPALPA